MLRYAEVTIGSGGLLRCGRCPAPTPLAAVPASDRANSIREAASRHAGCVALLGSDALANPAVASLIGMAREAGASRILVESAGLCSADDEPLVSVVAAGARHLRLHLSGAPEPQRSLASGAAAAPHALETSTAFYRLVEATGGKGVVTAYIRVCRHNVQDLPQATVALAEARVASVRLDVADRALSPRVAAPWLMAAADSGTVNRVWVSIGGADERALPGYGMHLTPDLPVGGGEL